MSVGGEVEVFRCKSCDNTIAYYADRRRVKVVDEKGRATRYEEPLDPAWCAVNLGPIQGVICHHSSHGAHEPNIPPLETVEDVQRFLEGL